MNRWLDRPPRRIGDWLVLTLAAGAVLTAVRYLPQAAGAAGRLLGLLAPFAQALLIAYVLDIPTRWLAEKLFHGRRGPSIAGAYLLFFGVLAALAWLVVPQLIQSVGSFSASVPTYTANLDTLLARIQTRFGIDTTGLKRWLDNSGANLETLLSNLTPTLAGAAMDAAGQLADFVVALAASVYLLAGKEGLLKNARSALYAALPPQTAGSVLAVCKLANRTFCGYLGGQLLDAVLVGLETFVLMLIFRLPLAPLIAVIVGVTNIVPVLGPYLGAIPGVLLLLLGGNPMQALEFLVIVVVVQQVDGNFVAPHILGDATGLSGLGVLFAIVVGGGLFGIPGMILGVPALGVLAALVRGAVGAGLQARGVREDGTRQDSDKNS